MARRQRYPCKDYGHFDCAIVKDGPCRAEQDAIKAARLEQKSEKVSNVR